MKIDYPRAEKLCTSGEMSLVEDTRRGPLSEWTTKQLKTKIKRAKTLRDKWKDQARNQKRKAQQAKGARGVDGNKRSQAKADLFSEVLDRFQKQLVRREKAEQRLDSPVPKEKKTTSSRGQAKKKKPTRKSASKRKLPPAGLQSIEAPVAKKKPKKKKQLKAKAAAKRARVKQSGLTNRVRGHVSARERRAQAKRDSQ